VQSTIHSLSSCLIQQSR